MKSSALLTIALLSPFFVSCSQTSGVKFSEQVIIDDAYKAAPTGEIVIDDQSFAANEENYGQRAAYKEITKINADNSRVTTMYDGFGNKTETRYFDNNPLLSSLTVRTSAAGEKIVSVAAQNGSVKMLPKNLFDSALTAPANDLAAAAGIFEGRREAPVIDQTNQPPLQPQPSYKFPVYTPPPVQPPVEDTPPEPADDSAPAEAPAAPESTPKQKPVENAAKDSTVEPN